MTYLLKIFLLVALTQNSFAQENNQLILVNEKLEEIQSQLAPDKRVVIFNISAVDSNDIIYLIGETNLPEAKNMLYNFLNEENIEVEDKTDLLPDEKLGENIYGIINLSVANIRSKPKHPAELSTQSLLGTPVKIYQRRSGFYLIQTPDEYIGWVDNDGIEEKTKIELDDWYSSDKIIYLNEFGFSYSDPDINSKRVSDLVAGNILIKEGEEEKFYKVKYPDGRSAYILSQECKDFSTWIEEVIPTPDNIILTAELFTGVPYLWGGTSAKGMDCSGFTKTVFFLNGLVLPRDASQQILTGNLVDTEYGFDNLQMGDLLFFGFKKTEKRRERITHVAIYIDNLEFIHASGKVKFNSFNKNADNFSQYRFNNFIRAKRIINSVDKNGITTIKNNKFFTGEIK